MTKLKHHKHYLFCPGPVNVADTVKDAVVAHDIGHREPEFEKLFTRLQKKILTMFEVKSSAFIPVILTGSGTAANEAVLSSIVGTKHILVLVNGEFGARLSEISAMHNPNTHILKFNWAEKIDLKAVETYVKNNNIEVIAVVHHETSTGKLNPIEKVGNIARKYGLTYFVDAVSSAGAEKIDLEKWHISFCSTSASKALASLSGLSVVIGKKSEFEQLKKIPARTTYLDLYKFYTFARKLKQTPNTPAVQLFFALEQAITNILDQGIEKRRAEIKSRAIMLREGMKRMGLKFLIDEQDMSSVLTTIHIPKHIDVAVLRSKFKEQHIIIYNGKGPFKDKVFQVGNIGEMYDEDILGFLHYLNNILITSVNEKQLTKKTRVSTQRKDSYVPFPNFRHTPSDVAPAQVPALMQKVADLRNRLPRLHK